MSKPVKELITRELAARYANATDAVWIELVGLDGISTNEFRRDLRARKMRLEVVKTSLFRRACQNGPLAPLAAAVSGPVALVTGESTAVELAKVLEEWLPKFPKNLRIRGAVLEGEYLDETRVKQLSKMPTRAELRARAVQIILTPGRRVAAAILCPAVNLAGCLKTLIDRLEKGQPVAAGSA